MNRSNKPMEHHKKYQHMYHTIPRRKGAKKVFEEIMARTSEI